MFLTFTTIALSAALGGESINTECPISGRPVETAHTVAVGNSAVGFCCPKCPPAFDRWSQERKATWIKAQSAPPAAPPTMDATPAGAYAGSPTGPYLLDICLVTGKKLGSMGDAAIAMIDGREVRFCCLPCKPKFEADKAKYFKQLDARLADMQRKEYPLSTCVISDEELDEDAVEVIVDNRLYRVCCNGCAKKIRKTPAKYTAKLDAAIIKAQLPTYPLSTCPIGKAPLDSMGGPVNMIVGNRLVQLCCDSCKAGVLKDPAAVIKQLDAARRDVRDTSPNQPTPE